MHYINTVIYFQIKVKKQAVIKGFIDLTIVTKTIKKQILYFIKYLICYLVTDYNHQKRELH